MALFQISTLKISVRLSSLLLVTSGICLLSQPSHAGFQWSPPPKPLESKVESRTDMMPPPSEGGPLMPAMPQGTVEATDLKTAPASGQISSQISSAPLMAAPAVTPVKATTENQPAPSTYAVIQGFGSDIPLALALRQIVPPQYGYVFDPDINQGTKISWNGDKPWDEVLNHALKPAGYTATVSETSVHILKSAPITTPAIPPEMTTGKPMLAPTAAEEVSHHPVAAPEKTNTREVYIRRNMVNKEVENRAPGEPETVADNTSVTLKATDPATEKSSGIWSKINPINWSSPSPVVVETDKVSANAGHVLTGSETTTAGPTVLLSRAPGEVSHATTNATTDTIAVAKAGPITNTADIREWKAGAGDSLKTTLRNWSESANVQLYWVPAQDYALPENITLQGNYTDAVGQLLGSYNASKQRPVGRLHPNLPNGPAVLIIEPATL